MSSELINEFIAGATTERKDQIISDLAKGLEQKKYTLGEIVEKISVFMASDQEITVSRAIILISETIGQAKQIHYVHFLFLFPFLFAIIVITPSF